MRHLGLVWIAASMLAAGCEDPPVVADGVDRAWVSEAFPGCTYASPIWVESQGSSFVLGVGQLGRVSGLDPETGEEVWSLQLPTETDAEVVELLSTPAVVDGRWVVLAWQERDPATFQRLRHRVGVVDLSTRALAPDFELLTLAASVPAEDGSGMVAFESRWQLQRSALSSVRTADTELGLVYVPLGNGPSEQPFHGWLFELDMDAWRDGAAADATSGVLLTTAENGCGAPGNRDPSVCGGGIWNPAGVVVDQPTPAGDFQLYVATGNGRMDPDVGAYAHSVMRVERGLGPFDPGCDAALCADFDELDPDPACQASCEHVFMARPAPGDPPLRPENGACDGLTFLECYGVLDGDLGANAPALVQVPGGPEVLVQPGKDGALYLVDAAHLGTMYQRLQVRDFCGTPTQPCAAGWAGMFVTQPAVAELDGDPVVIVPSLMLDPVHYAGISAYRVAMRDGEPRLEPLWDVPRRDDPEGSEVFRNHPGRPIVTTLGGEPTVFVVEVRRDALSGDPPGYLWGVRVRDGRVVARLPVTGAGQRFAVPFVHERRLYLSTCPAAAAADGRIEAFDLVE